MYDPHTAVLCNPGICLWSPGYIDLVHLVYHRYSVAFPGRSRMIVPSSVSLWRQEEICQSKIFLCCSGFTYTKSQ